MPLHCVDRVRGKVSYGNPNPHYPHYFLVQDEYAALIDGLGQCGKSAVRWIAVVRSTRPFAGLLSCCLADFLLRSFAFARCSLLAAVHCSLLATGYPYSKSIAGITNGVREEVFMIVAALLHLSNSSFMDDGNGYAKVPSDPAFTTACALLGCELGEPLVSKVQILYPISVTQDTHAL